MRRWSSGACVIGILCAMLLGCRASTGAGLDAGARSALVVHDFYALRLGGDDNGARALLAAGALSAVGQGLPDIRPATGSFCSYRWEQNGPDSFEVVVCRLVIDASARRVEVTEWTEHLRTASRGAGAEIDSFQVTAPAVVVQGRISP